MHLEDYMKLAHDWNAARLAKEAEEAQKRAEEIHSAWEAIYAVVEKALPVDGLKMAPNNYQRDEMPTYSGAVEVNIGLPNAPKTRRFIRAALRYTPVHGWEIKNWFVIKFNGVEGGDEFEQRVAQGPEDAVLDAMGEYQNEVSG